MRPNMDEYTTHDNRHLYLLGEGRLVNLAAAEGHPSEVMDMSFANQALCSEFVAKSEKLETKVYVVPKDIDEKIAELKLQSMGIAIDVLTEEQKRYLSTWEMGTT
jgi:adenosylhomocysteinase